MEEVLVVEKVDKKSFFSRLSALFTGLITFSDFFRSLHFDFITPSWRYLSLMYIRLRGTGVGVTSQACFCSSCINESDISGPVCFIALFLKFFVFFVSAGWFCAFLCLWAGWGQDILGGV